MIHMDLNKTMIMSDAVQGSSFKQSINAILADTACWGNVIDLDKPESSISSSDKNYKITQFNCFDNKLWVPVMLETNDKIAGQHELSPLIKYGAFTRKHLPYKYGSVDSDTKNLRKQLKQEFTLTGHPGEQYAPIVDKLYNKMKNKLITPAFLNMLDYLTGNYKYKYSTNKQQTFSIVFRTFGTDLPHVVEEFNHYCNMKGYNDLCVTSNENFGIIVHSQKEPHLVVGTFNAEPRWERVPKGMTLDEFNKVDRLEYYNTNKDKLGVIKIINGYKNIYNYIKKQSVENKKTMAIRDDYCNWALHGEKSEAGKIMILDCDNIENTITKNGALQLLVHQIFFDDCAHYIVNSRNVDDLSYIPFEKIEGIHAIKCNSYEIMMNDNFFIDNIKQAQEKFE